MKQQGECLLGTPPVPSQPEYKLLKGKEVVKSTGGGPQNPTSLRECQFCPSLCGLRQAHASEMVLSPVKEGVLPSQSLRIKCGYINT